MVIDDLHILDLVIAPYEADPPLVIDADAVLSGPRAAQGFEAVAWRDAEITQMLRRIERLELRSSAALNLVRQTSDRIAGKQCRRALVGEAFDHGKQTYREAVRSSRKNRTAFRYVRQ